MAKKVYANTVKALARKNGSWSGYVCSSKMWPFGSWQLGVSVTVTVSDNGELLINGSDYDKFRNSFEMYNV